ncbi:Transcription factor UPBEAT1 [Abeliophyllum distichum]|uniref:Transcription factor UPBEAT1 n=1 Tax=Abeliophyllum distichum TaxID=126358 RepID=A0ABD1TD47_9LAMI
MGDSQQPLHELLSKPLWTKYLESQGRKKWASSQIKNIRCKRILMKRRARLDRSKRPRTTVERKVRILKKLIPDCESMGVEMLFRETADYIMALQMRVKVMQIMVNALSGSDE